MTERGAPSLEQVGDGVFAYLQRGGWGYSNAGLIAGHGKAVLIDTLYDEQLTGEMLQTMRHTLGETRAIDTVVNTHANGDHCWGNAKLASARIVSSRRAAQEMAELSPRVMHTLVRASRLVERSGPLRAILWLAGQVGLRRAAALLDAAPFVSEHFGPFAFDGVTLRLPDTTFDAQLTLELEGRRIELIELGPAHTRGDVIAYVPDARVVFTGDLLFAGSHPVAWEGPTEGWIAACDRILALDADVVVPGHGPISGKLEVAETKRYWEELLRDVKIATDAGLDYEAAARAIAAQSKLDWREASRLVVNVHTISRAQRGETSHVHPLVLLAAMARFERSAATSGAISTPLGRSGIVTDTLHKAHLVCAKRHSCSGRRALPRVHGAQLTSLARSGVAMPLLKRPALGVAPGPYRPARRVGPAPPDVELSQTTPTHEAWLVLVPAAILLGLVLRSAWVAEDAYITLRTVDNWFHGYGLRWNVDERVQAYTHPLWMLALSFVYALFRQGFASALLLGVATTCAALLVVVKLARSHGHAIAAVLLLASSRAFIDYATSGLENPLSHLLLGCFVLCYAVRHDDLLRLTGLSALIALTRSDAVLLVAPALAHAALLSVRGQGVKRASLEVLVGLSPLLAWEAFSLLYYGALVPNTAFAKLNTGVSAKELMIQGAIYVRDALAWDAPILLITGLGIGLALASRSVRPVLLALGASLYLLYVVRIGGDFMMGRFLTLPLFAAVCLIAMSELPLERPAYLAIALIPFALLQLHPNATEQWPIGSMGHDGVADERAYYRDTSSLMMWTRTRDMPSHSWIADAQRMKARAKRVDVAGNVGLLGFFAGPSVHIIDTHALTDPLLARLPARHDPYWRIGHYARQVPDGYAATIETGRCEMSDEALCEYYGRLRAVVSADLWSWQRFETIVAMNLGRYDHLIDFERYRYPGRAELSFSQLSSFVAEDVAWNAPGMHVITNSGALVRLDRVNGIQSLSLTLDGNDDYLIEFRNGAQSLGHTRSYAMQPVGAHTRNIAAPPEAAKRGFDNVFILPVNGDGNYSLGYLRLCL